MNIFKPLLLAECTTGFSSHLLWNTQNGIKALKGNAKKNPYHRVQIASKSLTATY